MSTNDHANYAVNFHDGAFREFRVEAVTFEAQSRVEEYERLFPGIMKVFELAGIHPTLSLPMENQWLPSLPPESFTNIGEHSIAAAECARRIARALINVGVLDNGFTKTITRRALVHDITKAFQVMFLKAEKAIPGCTARTFTPLEFLRKKLIRARVPWDVIQEVETAGWEAGHKTSKSFLRINASGKLDVVSGRLIDKIVRLSDDMTLTSIPSSQIGTVTSFVAPAVRLTSTVSERYPFATKGGLAINSRGGIDDVEDLSNLGDGQRAIASYLKVHIFIANMILEEFKTYIAPANSEPAVNCLLALLM